MTFHFPCPYPLSTFLHTDLQNGPIDLIIFLLERYEPRTSQKIAKSMFCNFGNNKIGLWIFFHPKIPYRVPSSFLREISNRHQKAPKRVLLSQIDPDMGFPIVSDAFDIYIHLVCTSTLFLHVYIYIYICFV